jgi:signal peptidase II
MKSLYEIGDIKNLIFRKQNILFALIILIIFIIDRISKINIINNFNENSYFINSFTNLDLIWNVGIGFGFLSTDSNLIYGMITLFIGLVILMLIYVLILSNNLDKLIYSMIIGGAIGNFYDRLMFKAVPDFIDLHYNNFHWFTFNVADIFITVGIMIFILRSFFVKN